jgi:hypothetical protein
MPGQVFTSNMRRAGCFMVSEAEHFRARDEILVLSGQVLTAGMVLGKVASGGSAVAVAGGGNVGNGVMGAVTVTNAEPGLYQVVITAPGTNTGEFEVRYGGEGGEVVGQGTVATAYSAGGLAFTLADGATDFTAGDRFDITVSGDTFKYKQWNPANTDGSDEIAGILWDDTDATAGDLKGAAVTRSCSVNRGELVWFTGATAAQIAIGIVQLQNIGIQARSSVPA